MSKVEVARNLLFGMLALQTGLISQGALFAAFNVWTRDKARSLDEILVEQGDLDAARLALLDGLIAVHLKSHGDDPAQSLAAIDAGVSTRERLAQIEDSDLAASVARIGANHHPIETSVERNQTDAMAPSSTGADSRNHGQLATEQFARWGQGERVLVEALLEQQPDLRSDPEAILDLIYDEVVLREKRGETPGADEYIRRFPALREAIREQFDIHRMFAGNVLQPSEAGVPQSPRFAVGMSSSGGSRFRVLRPYAQGGLGAVFVALDTELHREVALKQILDRHADNPTSRRRFLVEAEIAGGLEHPGIVPVYGLGTYDNGRPFYAMRFIRGDSLKDAIEAFHADVSLKHDPGRRSLELRKLLRRFLDVCNAIEYAHSRGVLHRDLKPGNIIVGKHGETLVVDWGLAKSVGRSEQGNPTGEQTLVPSSASGSAETLPGSTLGTPAFMSPEQAAGQIDRLGARSDVYSLGATLYMLLTGRSPFEGEDVAAILKAVCGGEFEQPKKLDPSIDPALDAVCIKAMARSPSDRYASPRALADDIESWTADEPVSARAEPLSERARRWARRHRTSVTTAAAVLLVALLASVAIAALQAVAARRERLLAKKERSANALAQTRLVQVEKGNEILGSVFKDLDPRAEELQHKPLRAILGDRLNLAAASLEGETVGDALTVAKLQDILGQSQASLGNTAEAITLLHRSFQTRQARLGPTHPDTLLTRSSLFALYHAAGRAAEVFTLHQATLKAQETTLGPLHPDTLRSRNSLAAAYASFGRAAEAAAEYEATRKLSEVALGRNHPVTVESCVGLAEAYRTLGRTDEAAKLHQEALEARQRILGPDHPDTLISRENLTSTLWSAGRYEQAVALYETSLKLLEANLGPDHPDTLLSRQNLGVAYDHVGRTDQAIATLESTLKSMESKLGADHPDTLTCRFSLARSYRTAGRITEAIASYEAALRGRKAKLGPDHLDTLRTAASLAGTYVMAGRNAEAIALFEPALNALELNPGPDHAVTIPCRYNLAAAYRKAGRPDLALPMLEKSLKIMVPKLGEADPETLWVRASLAQTLCVMGRVSEAIPMLESALRSIEQKLPPNNPRVLEIRANLAAAYKALPTPVP